MTCICYVFPADWVRLSGMGGRKHKSGGAVRSFGVEEKVPDYEVGSPLRRLNVGRCSASVIEMFAGKRKGGRMRG